MVMRDGDGEWRLKMDGCLISGEAQRGVIWGIVCSSAGHGGASGQRTWQSRYTEHAESRIFILSLLSNGHWY